MRNKASRRTVGPGMGLVISLPFWLLVPSGAAAPTPPPAPFEMTVFAGASLLNAHSVLTSGTPIPEYNLQNTDTMGASVLLGIRLGHHFGRHVTVGAGLALE